MEAALSHVTREELWGKIERREDFALVDALAPISFAASHLPGAISMPPETVDGRAARLIPDRDTAIVVYCSSSTCESSVTVGLRLIALGYTDVRHYSEGKQDWADAGLPLEGGRV